jgi:hypothetical protein
MSQSRKVKSFTEIIEGILDVIDDAPLLPDEKQEDFDLFFHSILAEIKPRGLTEKLRAYELAMSLWELRRYRRLRNHWLNVKNKEVLQQRLEKLIYQDEEAKAQVKKWQCGDAAYARYLTEAWADKSRKDSHLAEALLERHNVSMSEIVAEGLSQRMKSILVLEATIAELVKRCDRMIAEFDRRAEVRARLIDVSPVSSSSVTDSGSDDDEPA